MARTSILSQQALEALNEQLSSLQPYQRANLLASLDAKQIGDSIEHGRDEYRDELTNFVLSAGSHLIFHPKAYLPDVVRKFEKFSEIYLESVRVLISVFQSECTYLRKSSRIDSRLGELSDHLRTLEAATDAKTIEKIDAGHMPDREMRDSFESFVQCESLLKEIRQQYPHLLRLNKYKQDSSIALQILEHSQSSSMTRAVQAYRNVCANHEKKVKVAETGFYIWSVLSSVFTAIPQVLSISLAVAEIIVNNAGAFLADVLRNGKPRFKVTDSPILHTPKERCWLVKKVSLAKRLGIDTEAIGEKIAMGFLGFVVLVGVASPAIFLDLTVKRERRENPNSEAIKFLDKLEGKEKAASLPNDSQTKSDTSKSIKPHAQMLPASPKGLEIEKLSVLRSDLYKKNFMPVTLVQHSSAVKKPLLVRRLG